MIRIKAIKCTKKIIYDLTLRYNNYSYHFINRFEKTKIFCTICDFIIYVQDREIKFLRICFSRIVNI